VHINKGSSAVADTPYNQTLQTNSNGNFTVQLPTGSYFFTATYTDANGFIYNAVQGVSVNVGNTSGPVNNVAIIVE
jgi:hypothetical protein